MLNVMVGFVINMTYKELQIWAKEYDSTLLATDDRFKNNVQIHSLIDTASFILPHAFAILKNNFYVAFTEHYGYHIFDKEDYKVKMFKNLTIEEIK